MNQSLSEQDNSSLRNNSLHSSTEKGSAALTTSPPKIPTLNLIDMNNPKNHQTADSLHEDLEGIADEDVSEGPEVLEVPEIQKVSRPPGINLQDFQNYQKLRDSGSEVKTPIPGSPREFFNCVFCCKNISPRGGMRVVKKTDLIDSYKKEKSSPRESHVSNANPSVNANASIPTEMSCAECSLKIKSFHNSPRRNTFQREKSFDVNLMAGNQSGDLPKSANGTPIPSPRGPPSPLIHNGNTFSSHNRSPMRSVSISSSSPIAVANLSAVSGMSRRSSDRNFTPPKLVQSLSFNHIESK